MLTNHVDLCQGSSAGLQFNTQTEEVPVIGRCGLTLINNKIEAMNFRQFENESSEMFPATVNR